MYFMTSSAISPSFNGLGDIKVYFVRYLLFFVEKKIIKTKAVYNNTHWWRRRLLQTDRWSS